MPKDKFGNYSVTDEKGFTTSSATPITAQSLAPTAPIVIPEKPTPLPVDTTTGQAAIDAQMKATTTTLPTPVTETPKPSAIESFLSGLKAPSSQTEAYKTAYTDSGMATKEEDILAKQKIVKTAQSKLGTINAQLEALNAEAKAIPIQVQQEATGRGITTAGAAPITTARLRENALKALPLQAQALAAQAEVQSAQGDVELAQNTMKMAGDRLTTLFTMQSKDIENEYNHKKYVQDKAFQVMTDTEKTKLAAIQKEDERNHAMVMENLKNKDDWAKTALASGQADLAARITQLDPKSKTYTQDLAMLQAEIRVPQKGVEGMVGGASGENLYNQLKTRNINFKELPADQKKLAIAEFGRRGETIPRSLGAKELDAAQDAISGLDAVRQLKTMAESGKLPLAREAIFGDTALGRFTGTSQFLNVAKEATDIKTRIRTGAALNESEIKFYASQRPQFGDSPADVQNKLAQLEGFYLGTSGLPVTVVDDNGNAYEFNDLFDTKQRFGLREAISKGLKISY